MLRRQNNLVRHPFSFLQLPILFAFSHYRPFWPRIAQSPSLMRLMENDEGGSISPTAVGHLSNTAPLRDVLSEVA